MKSKQITINREWLERLVEISERVSIREGLFSERRDYRMYLNKLHGYIQSAEYLLKEAGCPDDCLCKKCMTLLDQDEK